MPRSPQPTPARDETPSEALEPRDAPARTAEAHPRPVRILQYDIVRVLAVVAVVLIHTTATAMGRGPGNVANAPLWMLRPGQYVRWAVPAFAFLTGALMWTRSIPLRPGPLRSFLQRRFLVVVVPYVVWAAVYFVVGRYMGIGPSAKLPEGLVPRLQIGFDLLIQGRVWYHLYFVPVVLMLYLAAPFVSPLGRRFPWLLSVAAFAASVTLPDVVTRFVVNHDNVKALALLFLAYAPYAAVGAWYATDRERWDRLLRFGWPAVLIAGTAGRWADLSGWLHAASPAASRLYVAGYTTATVVGLLGAAIAVAPVLTRQARALADASAWSYGVYLVHPLLLLGLETALAAAGLAWLWRSPLFVYACVPLVTAAAFALSSLLHRSRLTAWLM